MAEIRITTAGLEPAIKALSRIPGAAEKATKQALKYAVTKSKPDASKFIRARYTARSGDITPQLKTSVSGMSGSLTATGKPLGIDHFTVNPKSGVVRGRGRYIYSEAVRGQKLQLSKGFRAMGNLIFERQGASRLPIQRVYGPMVHSMAGHSKVADKVQSGIEQRLCARFMEVAASLI